MTENELKIELMCYKQYVNPDCDLEHMSKEELEEFYDLYVKSEKYVSELPRKNAKLVTPVTDNTCNHKRERAVYKQ